MDKLDRRQVLVVGLGALAFALIGAIVALLVSSSGGGSSSSLRNLMLQPNDLPSEFALTDEKFYSREELLRTLPAESQIAEAGLQDAAYVSYESPGDDPMVIEISVYGYADDDAAGTAQTYLRESDWNHLFYRIMKKSDWYSLNLSSGLEEGMGPDAFSMNGELAADADSTTLVSLYFMRRGSARAEVLITGPSPLGEDAGTVARNQFLRLERPDAVSAP